MKKIKTENEINDSKEDIGKKRSSVVKKKEKGEKRPSVVIRNLEATRARRRSSVERNAATAYDHRKNS